jgi:hypothetical protein
VKNSIITILLLLVSYLSFSQCTTGTPPTLTCGTNITVTSNTAAGNYGTVSTSAASCTSGGDKTTESDIYKVEYQPGKVIFIDQLFGIGDGHFLELYSLDGCTNIACERMKLSGLGSIDASSFFQDGDSRNGMLTSTLSMDDLGLTAGDFYLFKFASNVGCGGSPCGSAAVGGREYEVGCVMKPENSCENVETMVVNTTYSITNEYAADLSSTPNEEGVDCGASVENNLMYRWCTDASNTSVYVDFQSITITDGTNIQFSILSDDCGGDFTDIQCESGISTPQEILISPTVASTCYWVSFDGNGGATFVGDVRIVDAPTLLPIELVTFTGNLDDDKIILKWVTASETNNDYFEIYWSDNGNDWELVGEMNGAGNSNRYLSYYHTHKDIQEDNYYKVRQVDYDGESSTTNIVYVKNNEFGEVDKKDYIYRNILGQKVSKDYKGYKIKIEKQ